MLEAMWNSVTNQIQDIHDEVCEKIKWPVTEQVPLERYQDDITTLSDHHIDVDDPQMRRRLLMQLPVCDSRRNILMNTAKVNNIEMLFKRKWHRGVCVPLYWLARESITNNKILLTAKSLLCYESGLKKMEFFPYKSQGTQWERWFWPLEVLLRNQSSAKSESDKHMAKWLNVLDELNECRVSVNQLLGFCSDGASVMTGKRNRVAAKLKELNISVASVQCICHKLSLACCGTNKETEYIKEMETWLIQTWKFFDNSPKRLFGAS